jgi:hypothetical protein
LVVPRNVHESWVPDQLYYCVRSLTM